MRGFLAIFGRRCSWLCSLTSPPAPRMCRFEQSWIQESRKSLPPARPAAPAAGGTLVGSTVTPVCPHFPVIPAASPAGSTFPAHGLLHSQVCGETTAPSTSDHKHPALEGAACRAGHGETSSPAVSMTTSSGVTDGGMQVGMLPGRGPEDGDAALPGVCIWRGTAALGLEISSGKCQAELGAASARVLCLAQLSPRAHVAAEPRTRCDSSHGAGRSWGGTGAVLLVSLSLGTACSLLGPAGPLVSFSLHPQCHLQLVFLHRIFTGCPNLGQNVFPAAGKPRHSPRKVEREEK